MCAFCWNIWHLNLIWIYVRSYWELSKQYIYNKLWWYYNLHKREIIFLVIRPNWILVINESQPLMKAYLINPKDLFGIYYSYKIMYCISFIRHWRLCLVNYICTHTCVSTRFWLLILTFVIYQNKDIKCYHFFFEENIRIWVILLKI